MEQPVADGLLRTNSSIARDIGLLLDRYGPFEEEPRLDAAHEIVFTILSQHTSDLNSSRAFKRLMERFGTLEAVAAADVADIEEAIASGGLAKVKAPRIKEVLGMVLDRNGGSLDLSFLRELPLSDAKAWLRQLPGIGPKSAGIILNFSLGMPAMAIDHPHLPRLQAHGHHRPKVSADKAHDLLEAAVEPDSVYQFHLAFITHGRQVCKAQRPRCPECVVAANCPSRDQFAETERSSRGQRRGGCSNNPGADGKAQESRSHPEKLPTARRTPHSPNNGISSGKD